MELARPSTLVRGGGSSSRSVLLAGVLAVAALGLLVAALGSRKHDGGAAATALTRVVVADRAVPKGSSVEGAVAAGLLQTTRLEDAQLRPGAISDVSVLRGQVASHDILPGEQVVAGDFAAAGDALPARLTRYQRAVSVPLDAAHGLGGNVKAGDHVDVLGGFQVDSSTGRARPVVRVLARDVVVLKAPAGIKPDSTDQGVVTLRVTDTIAGRLAFAADNGKVWLLLRPGAGAADAPARPVDMGSLLFGTRPVPAAKPTTKGSAR